MTLSGHTRPMPSNLGPLFFAHLLDSAKIAKVPSCTLFYDRGHELLMMFAQHEPKIDILVSLTRNDL